MTSGGVFGPLARAIILGVADGRCVGCGRTDVTCQHRRARGMGGTDELHIGHPGNGVALCGDGVRGCHGWAEAHPRAAALLGWRLAPGEHALDAPWWAGSWGWRRWVQTDPGFVAHAYVDPDEDLDRRVEREAALEVWRAWDARRYAGRSA